jgi:2-keto-4-pentenoate hydratase/2-oxohepta-3-ene-1,7-dioic acid hydratase in catechol pathway
MALWLRFEHDGRTGFGTLEGETITVHEGDPFARPAATGETLAMGAVTLLTPTAPSKMVALWNNFHALAQKLELAPPEEPLYFLKANSSFLAHGQTVRRPASYGGRVVYEGELGIVIGKPCRGVGEAEARDHIFGYTCVNDVTAVDLLKKDPTFDQWTRAKSFDGFGVFGPVVATGLESEGLRVRTVLNGEERQNYPVSDMIFPPARLVGLISRDMTLLPGDVIACGMIEGIGTLANVFEQ